MIFLYGCLAIAGAAAALLTMMAMKAGQARRASSKETCYYCGCAAIHESTPKGMADWLLANWNCIPYRCEVCFRRHYRRVSGPAASD